MAKQEDPKAQAAQAAGAAGEPDPQQADSPEVDDQAVDAQAIAAESEQADDPVAPEAPAQDEAGDDDSEQADSGENAEESQLAQLEAKVAELTDQLARARADTYNVSQEYSAFVRRSRLDGAAQKQDGIAQVVETLLSVLDDIALARQHGDLEGPAGAIAAKLEHTLEVNFKVVRFGSEGDDFDPQYHEALMHSTSDDVDRQQVGTLIQPGYKLDERVLRPARVGVVSPQ